MQGDGDTQDEEDDHDEGDDHDDEPLSREEQRQFRALAARANYLAQARPPVRRPGGEPEHGEAHREGC